MAKKLRFSKVFNLHQEIEFPDPKSLKKTLLIYIKISRIATKILKIWSCDRKTGSAGRRTLEKRCWFFLKKETTRDPKIGSTKKIQNNWFIKHEKIFIRTVSCEVSNLGFPDRLICKKHPLSQKYWVVE